MANHITKLRIEAGFKTARAAAKQLNISDSMMYQMEGGYKQPSPRLGLDIARKFNCTLEDIFLPFITTSGDNQRGNLTNDKFNKYNK